MLQIKNYQGAVALDSVQQLQQTLGTGIVSGCEPTLSAGSDPITIDVAQGTPYVNGTKLSFSGGSASLDDGDSQYPRKDLVCIDSNALLQVVKGTPRPARSNTDPPGTDRETYQPEPADLSGQNSVGDLAPVAEIWVPPNVESASELDEAGVTYVSDRRLPPWASELLTSGEIEVTDLAYDPVTQGELSTHSDDADIHHTKTTSASDLTDVSADSVADAHHTKTSSASDLTDVSADSVANAHHDKTTTISELTDLHIHETNSVQLSGGEYLIDLGVAPGSGDYFTIYFEDTNGAAVAGEKAETGGGNQAIRIVETSTSIGNPTVSYRVLRSN